MKLGILKKSISGALIFFSILVMALSSFSYVANAQPTKYESEKFEVSKYLKIEGGQSYLDSGAKQEGALRDFVIKAIKLLITVIGSFALLFVITGGLLIMISHGSSSLQQKGKQILIYSLVGLAVAFLSLIMVTFVQSLFYSELQ